MTIIQEHVEEDALCKACWMVGTTILETAAISDEVFTTTSNGQGGVERGGHVLTGPLFLASSVLVPKPARILAQSLMGVVCVLVSRLAAYRLRAR
jgi:hypothetical protein